MRGFVLRQRNLGCDIVGQAGNIFCRDRVFLCRDIVGQGKDELFHDKVFSCRNRI